MSDTQLRCPTCGNEGGFYVAAEITVRVTGDDYLTITDESGDREYGSESLCRCDECGHCARMGDFYKDK